jgi:hypothetical protein
MSKPAKKITSPLFDLLFKKMQVALLCRKLCRKYPSAIVEGILRKKFCKNN